MKGKICWVNQSWKTRLAVRQRDPPSGAVTIKQRNNWILKTPLNSTCCLQKSFSQFVIELFFHWPGARRDRELRYWNGNYVVSIIPSTSPATPAHELRETTQQFSPVQTWSCQQGDNTGGGGGGGGVITEDANTPVVWLSGSSDQSDEEVGNNILSPQQTSQTSPGHQN